jgi:hypothetical protein
VFDHLIWWQVLALLAPVVGLTYYIRWQEQNRSITHYKDLTAAQKGWVFLNLLPPGSSAKLLLGLESVEQQAYLNAGKTILGPGRQLHEPVIREFLSYCDAKQVPSEPPLWIDRLSQYVARQPTDSTVQLLRKRWPSAAGAS